MGGGLPKSQNFCKFTKYFFVCQIHSEVLKHVLQMGGSDILSISTFNHYSRILKVIAVTGLFGNFSKKWGGSPIPKTLSKFTNMVLEMFPLIQNGLTLFKYIFICTVSTNLGCQSQKKVPVYYQVARIKPCWPKFPGI